MAIILSNLNAWLGSWARALAKQLGLRDAAVERVPGWRRMHAGRVGQVCERGFSLWLRFEFCVGLWPGAKAALATGWTALRLTEHRKIRATGEALNFR